MLTRLSSDVGQALTALRRRPAVILVPVLAMAIGIGASTAIFGALHTALFNPLPYPEPGQLVMGRATFLGYLRPWVAGPNFYDYRERSSVFRSLAAYRSVATRTSVLGSGGAESVPVEEVSWDLFRTLGIDPVLGRSFRQVEGDGAAPDVAIVSHGYWRQSLGGARDVIGRSLRVGFGSRFRALTIVGVMPRGFRIALAADVWIPMQRGDNTERQFHNWVLVGRLNPGVTIGQAQEQVDGISRQLEKEYPDSNRNEGLRLTALQDAFAEADRPSLLMLMAAIGVLLLVACADVAGLLLSRAVARQDEMAIRSALGATRGHLVRQLLAESVLLAIAAGGFGLLLAFWLRGLVLRLVPLESLGVTTLPISRPVLAFGIGVTLLTSAFLGLVPAWLGTSPGLAIDLRAGPWTGETRTRAAFRQSLVALQVAMSVVLLVAAALLGRSLMQLKAVDPGFRGADLLVGGIDLVGEAYATSSARVQFFTGFLDEVRALPGVTSANIVNRAPILDGSGDYPVWDAERPPAETSAAPTACARFVFPGYFRTMGIPLVAGRDLSEKDRPTKDHPLLPMVISQSVGRRLFPGVNPVGKRLGVFFGGARPVTGEVVGVVGDVRMNSLIDNFNTRAMYVPYHLAPQATMRLVVRSTGDPGLVASALRERLARRDRGLALTDVKTMERVVAESVRGFSVRAGAVTLFGVAALLLAMLGVYGVLALMVNRHRRDIGLRMAIGASQCRVLWWVVARGMSPVLVGLVLGLGGGVGAGQWLRGQLFNVPPTDVTTFAGVAVCLAVAAIVACLLPAWRAMHVNPVVALKAE